MKKYLLATAAAGAILGMSSPAQAGGYVAVFGGITSMSDDNAILFQSAGSGGSSYSHVFQSWFYTSENPQVFLPYGGTYNGYQTWWTHRMEVHKSLNSQTASYSTLEGNFEFDTGFVVGAAIGHDLGTGMRVELEAAFRKNNLDAELDFFRFWSRTGQSTLHLHHYDYNHYLTGPNYSQTFSPYPDPQGWGTNYVMWTLGYNDLADYSSTTKLTKSWDSQLSGELSSWSLMANVWFDINMNVDSITPFVGGGIGYANVELEVGDYSASDNGIAFQFGAGVAWDMPNSDAVMTFEYRRFRVTGTEMSDDDFDFDLQYDTNDFIVSYRKSF